MREVSKLPRLRVRRRHVLGRLPNLSAPRWFFFFQAEDGIRDYKVTGVQTCALPISGQLWTPPAGAAMRDANPKGGALRLPEGRKVFRGTRGRSQAVALWRRREARGRMKIGRASCRGRV